MRSPVDDGGQDIDRAVGDTVNGAYATKALDKIDNRRVCRYDDVEGHEMSR